MDIMKPIAVIGTNAWGGKLYGKAIRGNYVEDDVIMDAMRTAKECDIAIYDLAMAFCASKGVIPMCGCRKPEQVKDLADAASIRLTMGEIRKLEDAADRANVSIMGADLFRPFVLKERRKG